MLVNKSITETGFKPLSGADAIEKVRDRMKGQRIKTLPVVDNTTKKLIGQIDFEQLVDTNGNVEVSDLKLDEAIKIYQGQHIFEAARLILQYEMDVLPLVDEEWTFLGIITKSQVFEAVARMLNLAEEGSVITIELEPIDFSLSEIVQIIETEGAKILGATVESPKNTQNVFQVSVKLNMKDISRVTSALKRYDYEVLVESESTVFGRDLENRADELLKYIDM